MIARLSLAALVIALAGAGHAAPSAREAQLAAQARAAAARAQEQALAQGQTAALARLRQAEAATDAAAEKIVDLMRRRAAASGRLAAREADIAPLLPALVHFHADPVATLASMNLPGGQALAGAQLLGALARQIALDAANAALVASGAQLCPGVNARPDSVAKRRSYVASRPARHPSGAQRQNDNFVPVTA